MRYVRRQQTRKRDRQDAYLVVGQDIEPADDLDVRFTVRDSRGVSQDALCRVGILRALKGGTEQ